jgi:hypothetical protein
MSTYVNTQQTPMHRLQAQMAQIRLVTTFRAEGRSTRIATRRVKRIRHWQDGRFVSTPLLA